MPTAFIVQIFFASMQPSHKLDNHYTNMKIIAQAWQPSHELYDHHTSATDVHKLDNLCTSLMIILQAWGHCTILTTIAQDQLPLHELKNQCMSCTVILWAQHPLYELNCFTQALQPSHEIGHHCESLRADGGWAHCYPLLWSVLHSPACCFPWFFAEDEHAICCHHLSLLSVTSTCRKSSLYTSSSSFKST
jgi:hypothetical protein